MDRLTLPLEVGKKYMRRNGQVASAREITGTTVHRMFFDQGADAFIATGRVPGLSDHPHDIVADYIEPAKGHPHAALMALYAQDAAETDKPWERWEFYSEGKLKWLEVTAHPEWRARVQYRRKPKTIRIGEYDVPEPMRVAPEYRSTYWAVNPFYPEGVSRDVWHSASSDRSALANGMLHLTREAAEAHAKALISLTVAP